jgi:integrase
MAHLRWWSEKIDKQSVIARDNAAYAIADRVYVTNASKARELQGEQLAKVTDPCTAFALQLQAAFGLRLEESIKFTPAYADQGKSLVLKASWCKGGRARQIPVTTAEQRQLLDAVRAYCGGASLIPREMRYVDQLHRFKYQCGKAGIDHVHGHRHAYAQQRYRVLAGWECPACGGPTSKALTELQKEIDRSARLQISSELGHEREQITAVYLGR